MDENRKKALAQALGQIEKQFGKGSVMRMGDASAARDIGWGSTRPEPSATTGGPAPRGKESRPPPT